MAANDPNTQRTASVRQNRVIVTVRYNGKTENFGGQPFDTWEGANVTADNTKHRRGGMGAQVAVGGPSTIEDLTLSRDYDLLRDHAIAQWMSSAVGKGRVSASKQYLDSDGVNFGKPIVITGVLVGYNQPNADSDSGDVAMVELVINPDGAVG